MNLANLLSLAAIVPGNLFKLFHGYFVFLYLGPETIMPVASILASIIGFFLVFWRLIVRFIKRLIRIIRRMPEETAVEGDQVAAIESSSEDKQVN